MADQKPQTKGGGAPRGGGGAEKKGGKPAPASLVTDVVALAIVLLVVFAVGGYLFNSWESGAFREHLFAALSLAKAIATAISMAALAVIVYSFVRISEISKSETDKLGLALSWESERKQKNTRWERVEEYMRSANISDWKIAILEADNILDEIVGRMGYKGENLGERMKAIEASDFLYLDEAWQVHKLRNQIAHKGTDYELTKSEAEQAVNIYHRIFRALGYL